MRKTVTINSIVQLSSLTKKKNNNIDLTQATRVPLWLIQSPQKKTSKIINYLFVTKATLLLRISFLYFLFISFCHKIHFHHTPYFASLFFGKLKCLTEYVFFLFPFSTLTQRTHSTNESLILFMRMHIYCTCHHPLY